MNPGRQRRLTVVPRQSRSRLSLALVSILSLSSACEGKTGARKDAPVASKDTAANPDASDASAKPVPEKKKHKPAPGLYLNVLGGGDWRLEEQRGQVLLINVWATWCKPCRNEMPELARLHREYGPRGFSVVGVSTDPVRKEPEVRSMVEELELPFPILLDPDMETTHDWGVDGYPTSFVIDAEGGVRLRRDGIIYEHDEAVADTINEALADKGKAP